MWELVLFTSELPCTGESSIVIAWTGVCVRRSITAGDSMRSRSTDEQLEDRCTEHSYERGVSRIFSRAINNTLIVRTRL